MISWVPSGPSRIAATLVRRVAMQKPARILRRLVTARARQGPALLPVDLLARMHRIPARRQEAMMASVTRLLIVQGSITSTVVCLPKNSCNTNFCTQPRATVLLACAITRNGLASINPASLAAKMPVNGPSLL